MRTYSLYSDLRYMELVNELSRLNRELHPAYIMALKKSGSQKIPDNEGLWVEYGDNGHRIFPCGYENDVDEDGYIWGGSICRCSLCSKIRAIRWVAWRKKWNLENRKYKESFRVFV